MDKVNDQESLKQWYCDFVSGFRKEYEKLTTDEKNGIGNTNNFLNPCQMEIFWMIDPEYQLTVQSNFNDRLDKEIIINGPYESQEFQSKIIPILKDKRWMRSSKQVLPYGYEQFDTVGERMALEIYKFVEMCKINHFTEKRIGHKGLMGMIFEDTWIDIHVGNIGDDDYKRKITKTIQKIKQNAKTKQERMKTSKQPLVSMNYTYAGFGVHLFPPIVIGAEHKRGIDELVYNAFNRQLNHKILDMKIDNNQIIVNKDGFVYVESKSKENALKILNLIMAYGAFYGFPLHAVRENELVRADYDKQNLTVTGMQWDSETRRAHLIENQFNPRYNMSVTKTVVGQGTIQEILLNTEKLLVHEKLSEDMRLLNEGLTHFLNSEFAPSFIMSWSVIERHYSDLWHTVLYQKNIDDERLSKLNNSNQWTIDYVLEVLNLQDKIDEISYDTLMDLKRKRNKFYHKGKLVAKEDADRCLKYAMQLLVEKIKPYVNLSNDLMFKKSSGYDKI